MGNVLYRPVLREYEIPYLGRFGAPPEQQLPLSDLLVGVRRQYRALFAATREANCPSTHQCAWIR